MGLLDTHLTVATFDRRQMSASTSIAGNRPLNPAQQARDIIAVMKAIGYTTTSLCTSSSGGINGLQ
jgi:pimeloyl-ACP methyl ester carboxylesterase